MISVKNIRLDYKLLRKDARYRIAENHTPVFSWGAVSSHAGDSQTACRVSVQCDGNVLWDSDWISQSEQSVKYGGKALPSEQRISVKVSIKGRYEESAAAEEYFYLSALDSYSFDWISHSEDLKESVLYFKKEFDIKKPVKRAVAYVSGIGYHSLRINGSLPDESILEPLVSDYTKRVYFVMHPEIKELIGQGKNVITVSVGEGWRCNEGPYLKAIGDREVDFFGRPQLAFVLNIVYEDGSQQTIATDETWLVGHGDIVKSNLFNGETYDASKMQSNWDSAGVIPDGFVGAIKVAAPGGVYRTATLEPIRAQEIYTPKSITYIDEGKYLVDFGQNIAGVVRIRLPKLAKGQNVTLYHGEILDHDGRISAATLRLAECTDTYVAAGDERDLDVWQPLFTYHGFRYVEVTGLDVLEKQDIEGVSFYTDIALDSEFSCGSAVATAAQKLIVQTEKANIHGILTDCPQRDERMGWMNDATVRFEETPYNFDIGAIFPKIVTDLADTQDETGAITCTAPRIYGERPADPVCSSFLIAALQAYRFTGNKQVIEDNYAYFEAWENCLKAHSVNNIVQYSHYGDWAAPVYACVGGENNIDAVQNLYTPGIFMSTGYYYYNARLLSQFAEILGRGEDARKYSEMAEDIKKAILDKWWDGESGKMAGGSQGAQSFSLWLGIIPEDKRALAAKVLRDDLVARNYKFTTGNLCTRYLFDVLTENGYVDEAWTLMTSEEYPSFGYMLQNEATTVWERFELKREIAMNSHCHPMYGAVGYWLYAYIAGIRFDRAGADTVVVEPYFPNKLTSASARVETVKGEVSVHWMKRWGELSLTVSVPFGMKAEIRFDGKKTVIESGSVVLRKTL
ncbi:MAG: family 78 glycoside hydrolase catalytic domain [Clostridia bacterium]|nr:family 78 glycoside hydrolase catalytic domain [Clostridia bacterium]